jgi:hypothetical protein
LAENSKRHGFLLRSSVLGRYLPKMPHTDGVDDAESHPSIDAASPYCFHAPTHSQLFGHRQEDFSGDWRECQEWTCLDPPTNADIVHETLSINLPARIAACQVRGLRQISQRSSAANEAASRLSSTMRNPGPAPIVCRASTGTWSSSAHNATLQSGGRSPSILKTTFTLRAR